MDVFNAFSTTPYTFIQLSRGGVRGNSITSETEAQGIFKLRSALVRNESAEGKDSNATLHIKPSEPFVDSNNGNLVGHGIRINTREYTIVGQTEGFNYHSNELEHITVTLQETDL